MSREKALKLKKEHEFLLLSARVSLSDEERVRITELASGDLNWGEVMAKAYEHRIASLCHSHINALDDEIWKRIPISIRMNFLNAYQTSFFLNSVRLAEIKRLQSVFCSAGLVSVLMKGLAVGQLVYRDLGLRHAGDIDFLVTSEECHEAGTVAESLGMGYPFNRSHRIFGRTLALASTTRGRWASSRPGSRPTRTALTTWSGCGGPRASSAPAAATKAVGAWATAGSCAASVGHAVR